MEDDKKLCRELLKRFPVSYIREIAKDVECDKTKRLESLFTRYIGCKDIECIHVEWDNDNWSGSDDWNIFFRYENKHNVKFQFFGDKLFYISYASQDRCIVQYNEDEIYIDEIREPFMPSAEELECIRLVLGIVIRPNCHEFDGTFNMSALKYFYKHVWLCFNDDNHFYRLESVYTVLLIHKHCPDSLLARLSKDVLKLILIDCI